MDFHGRSLLSTLDVHLFLLQLCQLCMCSMVILEEEKTEMSCFTKS